MDGKGSHWGHLVIVAAALGVALGVYERAILVADPLSGDEAYHSLWGLRIAEDIRQGQWLGLAYDTYRQVYWPPLHSWYLAALFLLWGPSDTLARASSLLALVGTAVAVYAAARLLAAAGPPGGGAGNLGGATVGGLAAAATVLGAGGVLAMASRPMLELPGLFWLAVSFWLYLRAWRSGPLAGRWPYVLLGLAVFATYLTRTNYGVLLALALAGAFVVDGRWLRFRGRQPGGDEDGAAAAVVAARRRGHIWAAVALALPLAVWFAYPAKIVATVRALQNLPVGPERFSLDGLLYFPRLSLWLAGSWSLLLVWGLAVVLSLRPRVLRSEGAVRFPVLFIGLLVVLAELSVTKSARHLVPLVPALALLVGYWAGRCWTTLGECDRRSAWGPRAVVARSSAVALALALLAWHAAAPATFAVPDVQPSSAGVPGRGADPARARLLAAVVEDVRQRGPALLLGSTDLDVSPAALDWYLIVGGAMAMDGTGALTDAGEQRFLTAVVHRLPASLQPPLRALAERSVTGTATDTSTAYAGLPVGAPELGLNPTNYRERVGALLTRHPVDRIVVVARQSGRRYPELTPEFITARLAELGFAIEATRSHAADGLDAVVLGFRR